MYQTCFHHLTSRIPITQEIQHFLEQIPRGTTGSIFRSHDQTIVFSTRSQRVAERLQVEGFSISSQIIHHSSQHVHSCECCYEDWCGMLDEIVYRIPIEVE